MSSEQQRGVFDKDGIRIVLKLRKPNDLEPGVRQLALIIGMLKCRLFGIDWRSFQVCQLAVRQSWADGASESLHVSLRDCGPIRRKGRASARPDCRAADGSRT